MVDRIVDAGELIVEAEKLATAFASGPPIPISDIKCALALSSVNDLKTQIDLESENQLRAFQSNDAREGMAAFFEKRPSSFQGT